MSMDGLAAFLAARLDEDEADALEAKDERDGIWRYVDTPGGNHKVIDDLGYSVNEHYDVDSQPWFTGRHIARHDPARALREVATWRRLLLEYSIPPGTDAKYGGTERETGFRLALSLALKCKAAEYSDHPDYDPDRWPSALAA